MIGKKKYSINDPLFGFGEDFEVGASNVLMLGGADTYRQESMALAYRTAADMLVQGALACDETSWEIAAPILHLYRHSLELYLKWAAQSKAKGHDLKSLIEQVDVRAKELTGEGLDPAVVERMQEFSEYDEKGFSFRYADAVGDAQYFDTTVKLLHLRKVMERIASDLAQVGNTKSRKG